MSQGFPWPSSIAMILLCVLAVGLACAWMWLHARRAGTTGWVLFLAAALVPAFAGLVLVMVGMVGGFGDLAELGPAVTPADLGHVMGRAVAAAFAGGAISVLAIVAGIIGLVRRPPEPEPGGPLTSFS